ncbi:MAG: pyrimidine 5'-nucleotidase [Desulfuromonas sp.]|uniref:pyrimidine 5'-nucleotidase n=1 Tax=Desulfuromonas sp. TaxID=892 RepID=UPI000CBC2047|nr:pyrimidine 5'-nucleotidase [Desulfuromonas sp.]PLX85467.1 MAG: pyrimidine 5'-nucleotidase [Desulfuromonas sp.]
MFDAILFDLDNTLYAPERQLFSLIDVRINRYMEDVAGIPGAEVDGLRRRYWAEYGVTLQGLMRHHGVDPEDYLAYVHDVDVNARLHPDPALRHALRPLPGRKAVFTNGTRDHAERVLRALELEDLFDAIFDIRVASYLPKPDPAPYRKVLQSLDVAAERCLMVEDSAANLKTAKALGMGTVLVGGGKKEAFVDAVIPAVSRLPETLPIWATP